MSFERDYIQLVKIAVHLVNTKGLNIDAEDLVSDVYLDMHGTEYDFELAKQKLSTFAYRAYDEQNGIIEFSEIAISSGKSDASLDYQCKSCGNVKHETQMQKHKKHCLDCFKLISKKYRQIQKKQGILTRDGVWIDYITYYREKNKLQRQTDEYKRKAVIRQMEWQKRNKEKYLAKKREAYKRKKENN